MNQPDEPQKEVHPPGMEYRRHLTHITRDDLAELREKDAAYGGSWKRRGGVNAYCMLARKIDRIETQMLVGYDTDGDPIFKNIFTEAMRTHCERDGLLEQIGDLRRYLLLVEAEVRERISKEIPF